MYNDPRIIWSLKLKGDLPLFLRQNSYVDLFLNISINLDSNEDIIDKLSKRTIELLNLNVSPFEEIYFDLYSFSS